MTLAILRTGTTAEGWQPAGACTRLEAAGADVVGLNCVRGPDTMLPLLESVRAAVGCHVAALPVPCRTHAAHPTFLSVHVRNGTATTNPFPDALEPFACTSDDVAEFARQASDLGVRHLGPCCGGAPHHVGSTAKALGRTPPASRYTFDPGAPRASRDRSDLYDDPR